MTIFVTCKTFWGVRWCLSNKVGSLSLHRKGAALILGFPHDFEWNKWVDNFSPHARIVWHSHFPGLTSYFSLCCLVFALITITSLLLKSLWYALCLSNIVDNLRSLMWGVGYKAYLRRWWLPILNQFFFSLSLRRHVLKSPCQCFCKLPYSLPPEPLHSPERRDVEGEVDTMNYRHDLTTVTGVPTPGVIYTLTRSPLVTCS